MPADEVWRVPDGTLAVGMQLPVQAQSRRFAEPWEHGAGVEEIAAVARAADEHGFAYVGVCDHVAIPRHEAEVMGTVWYDQTATLGYVAAVTSRVRLLTHVAVLPLRHPLLTAKAVATLDALSGGRVILGVGAGHVADEFAALGTDFDARGVLLDEAIDVVAAALEEEWPEHAGERFEVRDVAVAPRPVQSPRPPIWVGGSSRPALRRAAARGDGWIPQGTLRRDLPEQIAYLREHRRRLRGDEPVDLGAMELLYVGEPTWDVGRWCRSGPPEEIASYLRELVPLGVTHVLVRLRSRSVDELVEQIETFGAEVGPHLSSAGG